jgi:hypothetical protein
MLESFPVETSVVRVKKQPVKLEGFASEIPLKTYVAEVPSKLPEMPSKLPVVPLRDVRNVRPEPPKPPIVTATIREPRVAVVAALALALIVVAGWRLTPVAELRHGEQRQVDILLPAESLGHEAQPQAQPRESIVRAQPQPRATITTPVLPAPRLAAAPNVAATPNVAASLKVAVVPNVPAAKPAISPALAAAKLAAPTETVRPAVAQERVATSGRVPATIASFNARRTPATVATFTPHRPPATIASFNARPAPSIARSVPVELPRATLPTTIALSDASTLRGEIGTATAGTSGTNAAPIQLPSERLDVHAATVGIIDDRAAIQDVIRRYENAYERLDAAAAKQIWPSLDERALARAFAGLASQTLTLQPCRIDVGNSSAVASCPGSATYVGRVGSKSGQIQRRDWTFVLRKSTEGWQIGSVQSN